MESSTPGSAALDSAATVRDALTAADCVLPSRRLHDARRLELVEPRSVVITLESEDFDPHLFLADAACISSRDDDDGGTGFNSRLEATLDPGTYDALATHYRGSAVRTGAHTPAVTCGEPVATSTPCSPGCVAGEIACAARIEASYPQTECRGRCSPPVARESTSSRTGSCPCSRSSPRSHRGQGSRAHAAARALRRRLRCRRRRQFLLRRRNRRRAIDDPTRFRCVRRLRRTLRRRLQPVRVRLRSRLRSDGPPHGVSPSRSQSHPLAVQASPPFEPDPHCGKGGGSAGPRRKR